MTIFVKSLRNGSESYSLHEGMTQETVMRLLSELGATNIEFIDEETFSANVPK